MTTAERIAELQAQPGWKKCLYRDLGGDAADLLWCAERIAKLEVALRYVAGIVIDDAPLHRFVVEALAKEKP